MEPTHEPDALVLNSVDAGTPIIHVAINYRLGCKLATPSVNVSLTNLVQSLVSLNRMPCDRNTVKTQVFVISGLL